MKTIGSLVALGALVLAAAAWIQPAAPKPYKVVFDLTSDDPADQRAVLRWLHEIETANPGTDMEVVMYGRGLALVVPARSSAVDDVKQAIAQPHVAFRVCAIAMKNQKLEPGDLLPGVRTVPDGIGELVARQRDGWGYIKALH